MSTIARTSLCQSMMAPPPAGASRSTPSLGADGFFYLHAADFAAARAALAPGLKRWAALPEVADPALHVGNCLGLALSLVRPCGPAEPPPGPCGGRP